MTTLADRERAELEIQRQLEIQRMKTQQSDDIATGALSGAICFGMLVAGWTKSFEWGLAAYLLGMILGALMGWGHSERRSQRKDSAS